VGGTRVARLPILRAAKLGYSTLSGWEKIRGSGVRADIEGKAGGELRGQQASEKRCGCASYEPYEAVGDRGHRTLHGSGPQDCGCYEGIVHTEECATYDDRYREHDPRGDPEAHECEVERQPGEHRVRVHRRQRPEARLQPGGARKTDVKASITPQPKKTSPRPCASRRRGNGV